MRSSGNRGGTNNGGLDEMKATLNLDNEIDWGAMAETRKRWDYNIDNSLRSFTSGEDTIGSNKRNAGEMMATAHDPMQTVQEKLSVLNEESQ
ncbi:hypothetical protein PanWU01x14_366700 [Parasponia andersonii]|uniref:Uncharacterized protein n=1 Tax=Parasponia andersonii TaxID=3476 RepID=A0A2P5A5L3_PARAD|nr:hypothetical protein PanWU01x14_366700 [Parasponia andersonii]